MNQPPTGQDTGEQQPQYEAPPADAPRYLAPPAGAPLQPAAPLYAAPPADAPRAETGRGQQAPQPQFLPPQPYAPPQVYPSPQPQPYAPQQHFTPQQPQGAYTQQQSHYQQQPGYFSPNAPGPAGLFDGAIHPDEVNRPLYGASPKQAFIRFFKNYANFKGRASRSEYWWMNLIQTATIFGLAIISGIGQSLMIAFGTYRLGDIFTGLIGFLVAAMLLGVLVPWISLTWRRLQDANISGWFTLLYLTYIASIVVFIFTLLPSRPEGRQYDRAER